MGLPERTVWSDGGARLSVVARIASGDSEPAAIQPAAIEAVGGVVVTPARDGRTL